MAARARLSVALLRVSPARAPVARRRDVRGAHRVNHPSGLPLLVLALACAALWVLVVVFAIVLVIAGHT